ncbi:MAG: threonylcarbamoyl-AMP synthase [Candidatus Eremiobacteraeota bacterium]|nr:threonylcarbamoyl-AMP synthase [Candidatus Eremiobacteraeota bacterium]
MRTIDARSDAPERIAEQTAAAVFAGGVVIFPTDTVYGIGCDPTNQAALDRIYVLKNRPRHKPLALHFATVAELGEYVPDNPRAMSLAKKFLPGPLTLVVRKPRFVDFRVTAGLPSVSLRVPAHPLCWAILDHTGPLAATSANVSGSAAYSGRPFLEADLPAADLFVDAGPTPVGQESTILDLTDHQTRVIRTGAIALATLEEALGESILGFE